MTTVLLADDQELVRTGLRMILSAEDDLEVVGEAVDGADAVRLAADLRPDVVLMDIRMPGLDGIEATRRITRSDTGTRVVMLTTFDRSQLVYDSLVAGATGFLLKDVTPEHLVAAVRLASTGDGLLAPAITRRLVERFVTQDTATAALHRDLAVLTPRERQVLQCLGTGLSNAELAARFTLSEATVKTHVARILSKLRLRDRAQAVVVAYETGLVTPGGDTTGTAGGLHSQE